MSDLNEINPHFALWAAENYVSPHERRWERWVDKVEKILGHSLDGNQVIDGFSLDFAYDAFGTGITADSYADEIRSSEAYMQVGCMRFKGGG